ncbi:MAG: glycosyltransferase [Solobacterium sp.]|nr:glycosyltransferase [Solobacterium sp.]
MEKRISVIIPVYNKENYIRSCLDSVAASAFDGLEIICTDDGSTDRSLEILNEYQAKDSRIKVITLEHKCAAAARNAGLDAAEGEYIHFLDADDYLSGADAYDRWYRAAAAYRADICECLYTNIDAASGSVFSEPDYIGRKKGPYATAPDTDAESLIRGHIIPWNKLIRRAFLLENGIRFEELSCAEDRPFYYELIYRSKKTVRITDRLIIHQVNISTSLDGSDIRFRDFDVEFRTFESIWRIAEKGPEYQRMMLLDSCIGDSLYYLRKAAGTAYEAKMKAQAYEYWKDWIPLLGDRLFEQDWCLQYLEIVSVLQPQEYASYMHRKNSLPVKCARRLWKLPRKFHRIFG